MSFLIKFLIQLENSESFYNPITTQKEKKLVQKSVIRKSLSKKLRDLPYHASLKLNNTIDNCSNLNHFL